MPINKKCHTEHLARRIYKPADFLQYEQQNALTPTRPTSTNVTKMIQCHVVHFILILRSAISESEMIELLS